MIFVVDLLQDAPQRARPTVVRSVQFEADDLFKVVGRIRIILASNSFETAVDAFQVSCDGKEIIYQERRNSAEAAEAQSQSHSNTCDALLAVAHERCFPH